MVLTTLVFWALLQRQTTDDPPFSDVRALEALEQACDEGDGNVCRALALRYSTGTGAPQDEERAAELFQRAATLFEEACDSGKGQACLARALMAKIGEGMPRDAGAAREWFLKACEADSSPTCPRAEAGEGDLGGDVVSDLPYRPKKDEYDEPPRPIKITRPIYPQAAFIQKLQGTVLVELTIDTQGRVTNAVVVKSVPLLDAAAIKTVYQWRFEPAMKNGKPVVCTAHAPVSFRIY
jgi:TonB family protein